MEYREVRRRAVVGPRARQPRRVPAVEACVAWEGISGGAARGGSLAGGMAPAEEPACGGSRTEERAAEEERARGAPCGREGAGAPAGKRMRAGEGVAEAVGNHDAGTQEASEAEWGHEATARVGMAAWAARLGRETRRAIGQWALTVEV
ncbi:hypothetical protein BS78_02G383700 [Paspalum vaginatum]|nr:hypothetical protein BS78_02G383700 [Paspalum vaginatum]